MKLRALLPLLLLLACGQALGAIALGQSAVCNNNAATCTSSGITTAASGSAFVVAVVYDGTFTSLADNKSNTIGAGQLIYAETTTYSYSLRIYLVTNGSGGASHTWTLTTSGSGAVGFVAAEITGAATSSLLDQISIINDDGVAPLTSPSITTTQAAEMLIGVAQTNYTAGSTETFTWGNSFTAIGSITNMTLYWPLSMGYRIVSSTGSYNSEVAVASSRAAQVVLSLKEAAGGGGTQPPRTMHQFRLRNTQ